jgi:hypothetical protein
LFADYHLPINLGEPQLPNHMAPVEPRSVTRGRVAPLRGASVDVDSRRVGQILLAVFVAALTVLVVVLFVADVHRNSQISSLKEHGVAVNATVTNCIGELGGSGSTIARYDCNGTFELDGKHYRVRIPGSNLRPAGATVPLIAAENDPGLIATSQQVRSEHASWSAFIFPIVLLFVLVVIVVAIIARRRATSSSLH